MAEKYIPLSAAVDEMKSWEQENKSYHPEDYEDEEQEEPGIPVLEVIERLNSIEPADVRPVVLCRDCIRRAVCRTSNIWAVPPGDDWFCADGKRRGHEAGAEK